MEGGLIQSVYSNVEIDYVIVDFDSFENLCDDEVFELKIYNQDTITDDFKSLFTDTEYQKLENEETFAELTRINF